MRSALRVIDCAPEDPAASLVIQHPRLAAFDHASDARRALNAPESAFLHFPWPSLDAVVGGMPAGDLWYVGAFSGHGKTTFLTSLVLDWVDQGVGVYYMGLESRPHILQTHFACKRLGYDAGDLLSGAYHAWTNADAVREEVKAQILHDASEGASKGLLLSSAKYVDEFTLRAEAVMAKECKARVFVVDHVDHIQADGNNLYEASVAANRALLDIAHEHGFLVLAATQFNLSAVRGARSLLHVAPREDYVKMGNHKREVASGMLGLYRPFQIVGLDKDKVKGYNAGTVEASEVLEPNTMAVSVLKHRLYGTREGKRVFLGVEHGRVREMPERERGALHGIRTTRGAF